MAVKYLKICSLDRTPICDLIDKTPMRARAIVEELSINEITTLTFELPISNPKWKNIKNENLVYFNDEYYRIKKPSFFHGDDGKLYIKVECKHYSDNLANDLISVSETTPLTVVELMKIALCYDENGKPTKGWTVGNVTVDRLVKRGLEAMEQSPFSVLLTIAEKYGGILKFNSKTMTVDMLEMQTDEHPVFDLRVAKNLKSFQITYDTTEMFTRLYCYGATDDDGNSLDIMSVNPTGKPYIDNFDYFYNLGYSKDFVENHPELFVNTNIWRDDNYYDAQDLYNDGIKELAKIAQPVVNVEVSALDSKTLGEEADVTKFDLGACIRVIDEDIGADTMCNVVKRTINYEQPHILDMEVTSSVVYHDTLSKLFTNVNTASAVVTSGGNLVGGQGVSMSTVIGYLDTYYINAEQIKAKYASVETLTTQYLTSEQIKATYIDAQSIAATYATIGSLNAIEAQIKDLDVSVLNAKVAEIEELTAELAEIGKLIANEAEIEQLKADNITVVGKLTASQAEIDTIKSTYAQVGSFEAYKGTIENLFSTNAEIESLKSKYIDALKIETDSAKITQLESAIAKIETLQASMATIEKLVSETIITQDLEASKATIESLTTKVANIDKAIIDIAKVEDLEAVNAQIENLNTEYINAVKADVDELNANSATISQLTAYTLLSDFGKFENLTAENLKAANASIGTLDANVANIVNVLAGAVGTGLLQTIHLTAENVVIDDAIIKSAMIDNIDTDLVRIGNDNIIISGSTQQFKDNNGVVRIQIGQDAEGNFTFVVADGNGATIIGANGITENAVPDGLIVDKMVSDDAAIDSSKIKYVDKDGSKTLQTVIKTEQGKVEALIKETTIENEDGTTTTLKDAYTHTVQTVEGIETTIGDVTMLGDGESLVSSITQIKATADGVSTQVSSIGGQNLFYSCSKDWVNKTEGEDYIYVGCYKETTDNDMEGKYVTLSIEVKTDDTTEGTFDICYYGVDNPTTNDVFALFENITLEELEDGKYVNTFVYPDTSDLVAKEDGSTPMIVVIVRVSNISGKFSVRKGMFQYGRLATEWQPSSDNVSESLSIARQDSDKISWLIKSGDNETNFELTPRTANLVSEQINLKGLITISGLSSEVPNEILEPLSKEPSEGYTIIHGGNIINDTITSKQIYTEEFFSDEAVINKITSYEIRANRIIASEDGSKIKGFLIDATGLEVRQQDTDIVTFQIENTGDVTLRGTVESYNYISGQSGWSINADGDAEFNDVTVRGNLINASGGIVGASGDDVVVNAWFGASYEERESAPFIIYSDGTMVATKGTFGGVFTGNIEIGNISIIDPSNESGNDAILTIQNGNNGIKAVQLRDTSQSDFAQNINITDNFYNTKILFTQDGVGTFSDAVIVGDENNSTSINNDSININNSTISATSNGMKVLSNSFAFGSASASNNVEVWGTTTLQGNLTALGEVNIGNKLKLHTSSNGVDIDFIE